MQTMSEVQKIWQRVMSIRYRAGNRAVRIPSSNEFAREFGIARSSVRLALEKLTAEGFLITRKGCGTFINPKKCSNASWETPLLGLMTFDCNLFFYSPELQGELECIFGEIRKTGWNVRNVSGVMASLEEARQVLHHNYLDCAIAFGTEEYVVRAADGMMPVVSMGYPVEGVVNVRSDCSGGIEELFRLTGRSRDITVWCSLSADSRQYLPSCLRQQPGMRLLYDESNLSGVDDQYFAAVRERFAGQCPDWILIHPLMLKPIREIVIGLYGEARARNIIWIYHTLPGTERDWPGYFFRADRREETREAIRILRKKLNGETGTIPDSFVKTELIRCTDDVVLV